MDAITALFACLLIFALLKLKTAFKKNEAEITIIEKLIYNGISANAEVLSKETFRKWVEGEYPANFITYKFLTDDEKEITKKTPVLVSRSFAKDLRPTYEIEVLYDEKFPERNWPAHEINKRFKNKKKNSEILYWLIILTSCTIIMI